MTISKNHRKSQAEAFGLVLIVAIVFVIFAIMTRIEGGRRSTDVRSVFERTELSSSTVNTLLSTAMPECNQKTFAEVAIDCVRSPNSLCQNQVRSCEYFRANTRNILSDVFGRVGLDYFMTFSADGAALPDELSTPLNYDETRCSGDLRGEDFVLPLNPGTLVITLVVCSPN